MITLTSNQHYIIFKKWEASSIHLACFNDNTRMEIRITSTYYATWHSDCIQKCDGRLGFWRGIEASIRVGEAPESNHFINVSGHIGIFSTFPAIVHSLSASLFSVSDEYAQSSLSLARIWSGNIRRAWSAMSIRCRITDASVYALSFDLISPTKKHLSGDDEAGTATMHTATRTLSDVSSHHWWSDPIDFLYLAS